MKDEVQLTLYPEDHLPEGALQLAEMLEAAKKKKKAENPEPEIEAEALPAAAAADPLPEHYSYDQILAIDALYYLIFGMRSNGKTYGWCDLCIDHYIDDNLPSAYVRRLDSMLTRDNIANLFDPHIEKIKEKTKGKYNAVVYRSKCFYLARYATGKNGSTVKIAEDKTPFCRCYAINTAETSKGQDRGAVWSVCFDEFITRAYYLTNEFVLFQNLLSSIIRDRPAKIFMLANTVSKTCPYFREMGITNFKAMEPGQIQIYHIGKTEKQIAVEYCAKVSAPAKVTDYFAFDNPELEMITKGAWEIAMYRHPPKNLGSYQIAFVFFVEFDGELIQGDIIMYGDYPIIVYHPKTSEIKNRDQEIIYSEDTLDASPLHQISLKQAPTRAQQLILQLISQQKTFYSDNETGEIIANWLKFQNTKAG